MKCVKCGSQSDLEVFQYNDICDNIYMCAKCYTENRRDKCNNSLSVGGWSSTRCTATARFEYPACCGADMECGKCFQETGCDHSNHPTYLVEYQKYVTNYACAYTQTLRVCNACYSDLCYQDLAAEREAEREAEDERITRLEEECDDWAWEMSRIDADAGYRHIRVGA